eukprot:scaffold14569_cov49-Cyclotella_meneghiniana.AAC.6
MNARGECNPVIGPSALIEARGKDLTSNKNLADYLDKKGWMKLAKASQKVQEVSCERFFGTSG